ncbi:hypothetical protein [Streptomyces sp. NPDC006368]|uniref:hypothetical protein n=1 Tax=Streptomyces sp. NPDC006368 TaxID=3156760 RepID=UPI0033B957B7
MAEKGKGIPYIPGFMGAMFVETDFESLSHEELRKMVASANPETLTDYADKLIAAAKTIKKIGDDLKTSVRAVDWKGEAGTAFANWADQTSLATIKLSEYSETGGTWMNLASQTLSEVKKSIPEIDTAAKDNLQAAKENPKDTDSAKVSTDAQAKLEGDRLEAARQMRKLAQSYTFSSMFMSGAEAPVFPPPPQDFVPTGEYYGGGDASRSSGYAGGGASGTAYPSGAGYASSAQGGSTEARYISPASGGTVPSTGAVGTPVSDRPVGMGIDSVATLPPTQTPSPSTPAVTPPTNRPDLGMPVPGIAPPVVGKGPTGPAVAGGRPATGISRPPMSGQGPVGTGPGAARAPREGIQGGRAVPQSGGRTGGIPRGMVVGGEAMHGRPPMGGTGGGMHGPASGGQGGASAGRRLAYEGGGVVGGRAQQPGATGRPFTPGGTGLVRGGAPEGGARPGAGAAGRAGMAAGGQGAGHRREDRGTERPDYLTEDEETWQQSSRRIVPPVID